MSGSSEFQTFIIDDYIFFLVIIKNFVYYYFFHLTQAQTMKTTL